MTVVQGAIGFCFSLVENLAWEFQANHKRSNYFRQSFENLSTAKTAWISAAFSDL